MRPRLATTFASLKVRNYRLFLGGQLTKLLGVWMQFTAQDWLVLELTDNSAYALGVVTALQFTPDRKSTRLNSSHTSVSRMPSSA